MVRVLLRQLIIIALMACFVGRLHIFLGSFLFNCGRNPLVMPKPISGIYMFVMWFSGLRGGVAFTRDAKPVGTPKADMSRNSSGDSLHSLSRLWDWALGRVSPA